MFILLRYLLFPLSCYQHKDFDDIEARLHRREPLILELGGVQKVTRQLLGDVVSDPLTDVENDLHDEGVEIQRQAKNYKVNLHSFF